MTATAYVTPQQLVDEFGERELIELTDVATPRAGEVDTAVAQRACDRANAEVETSVAARYQVPLASVPTVLRFIARDLAHYYLYQTEPPSWVQSRFDTARRDLRDIRDGKLPLGPDVAGAVVAGTVGDLPEISGGSKVFGREDLRAGTNTAAWQN